MIRSVGAIALLGWGVAMADEPADDGAPTAGAPDDSLAPYREPFDVLAGRTIGTVSKSVKFDWRSSPVEVAVVGDQLFELNNFNSLRVGGMARLPSGGMIVELGLDYVDVWDTPSSQLLALTPYRQPGRPDRLEFDLDLGFPVAEGVVTAAPKFIPAAEMVMNLYGGLRYEIYPTAFSGMPLGKIAGAVLAPSLTSAELENLDDQRLDAMIVDPARYGLMVGFGEDVYFQSGLFISPRTMFAIPIMAPITGTNLLFSAEISLAVGWAFQ